MNKDGKVIKTSTRYRREVIAQNPPRDVPFYFITTVAVRELPEVRRRGQAAPFEPGHRAKTICAPRI
jgi:hypothetical protein